MLHPYYCDWYVDTSVRLQKFKILSWRNLEFEGPSTFFRCTEGHFNIFFTFSSSPLTKQFCTSLWRRALWNNVPTPRLRLFFCLICCIEFFLDIITFTLWLYLLTGGWHIHLRSEPWLPWAWQFQWRIPEISLGSNEFYIWSEDQRGSIQSDFEGKCSIHCEIIFRSNQICVCKMWEV